MPVAWMRHGIICVNSQHLMLANPSGCRTTTTRPGDLRGMPFGFLSVFGTIKVGLIFPPQKIDRGHGSLLGGKDQHFATCANVWQPGKI